MKPMVPAWEREVIKRKFEDSVLVSLLKNLPVNRKNKKTMMKVYPKYKKVDANPSIFNFVKK